MKNSIFVIAGAVVIMILAVLVSLLINPSLEDQHGACDNGISYDTVDGVERTTYIPVNDTCNR